MTTIEAQSSGLRGRQKHKRRAVILDCAKTLLQQQGYEATTMAKIAEAAEVSAPTVFNYFGSKDELIVGMVLDGHEFGRKTIASWQPSPALNFGELLAEMMCLYTDLTMAICGKRVWRYAEATNIRRPSSEVVGMYSEIETNHVSEIMDLLVSHGPEKLATNLESCAFIARLVYNHWNALFIKFVRDEAMLQEDFKQIVRNDIQRLAVLLDA